MARRKRHAGPGLRPLCEPEELVVQFLHPVIGRPDRVPLQEANYHDLSLVALRCCFEDSWNRA
jgi:hypothetical protein